MTPLPSRQRGVALLVALLVVALSTILIAALLDRGELAMARSRNLLRAEQAQAYAQGLEAYAAQVLLTTWDDGADTNGSPWALPLSPQEVPGGRISASLRDLNGCFNLNNLSPQTPASAQWKAIFEALLTQREIDPRLADAVQAWLDTDPAAVGDANHYLAAPLPYRPRGGPFAHVSELRLVRGVDSAIYARLAPHLCALPAGTLLNVNTADAVVLQALGLSRADAERLWQQGHAQYPAVEDFLAEAREPALTGLRPLLSTRSHWFLARGDISLDTVPWTYYSLIGRNPGIGVRVYARSRGSDAATATGASPPLVSDTEMQ